MRRSYVFVLQSLIAVVGGLLLFTQCRTIPEDMVRPVPTLRRGILIGDPVVESSPESVSLIKVNNQYDDILASPQFAGQTRPKNIEGYTAFKAIETIRQADLSKHEFNWVSTGRKNVMVAIFKNIVLVDSKADLISNQSDLVWMWTPTVDEVDPGRTTYAEGRGVSKDQTNRYTYSSPVNLNSGMYYVWYVLAWDSQGLRIEHASRELPLLMR